MGSSIRILHAGCGSEPLPDWLMKDNVVEVRLDADQGVSPDICASLTDMGDIGKYNCVYTCHCVEHLNVYEIRQCFEEVKRVLKDNGLFIVQVPDLEGIEPTEDTVFETPGGLKITGIDLFYGYQPFVKDNPFMIHKYGFTKKTLIEKLEKAGFKVHDCQSNLWSLTAIAQK